MSKFDQFFDDMDELENSVESTYPDAPEFEGKRGETARKMFDAINARRDAILETLKRGQTLNGRGRQIVRSSIAQSVGKGLNYFSKREFPELYSYLEHINDTLARVSFKPKKTRSKGVIARDELMRENDALRAELKRIHAEGLIELAVVDQLGVVRRKQIQAEEENSELLGKLKDARANYNAAIEQIQELMDEVTQLKQHIRDLGDEVKPTRRVRRVK